MSGSRPGVPRGTPVEPPPVHLRGLVEEVFGDRLPAAQRYVDLLATSGTERGLVGPREAGRLWERHVLDCAAVARLCPPGGDVVDVGSGAGLPGLVVALARPDLAVTLLEPLLRRVTWLEEVVGELGLGVRVLRARAEDSGVRAGTVTARAVAPLGRLVGLCLPLLAPGGQLLAMKGRSAQDELGVAGPALRAAGAATWEVLSLGPVGPPAHGRAAAGSPVHGPPVHGSPVHGSPVVPGEEPTSLATTVVRVTVRPAR